VGGTIDPVSEPKERSKLISTDKISEKIALKLASI
jgi:hypothetical protein